MRKASQRALCVQSRSVPEPHTLHISTKGEPSYRFASQALSNRPPVIRLSISRMAVRLSLGVDDHPSRLEERGKQYLLMCCDDEAQYAKHPDSQETRIMVEYGNSLMSSRKACRMVGTCAAMSAQTSHRNPDFGTFQCGIYAGFSLLKSRHSRLWRGEKQL